ncbi:methyl-accepting chemotaxis protein [Enterovibrio sp. ZSDZ42]|uniref:Methyl-accepting chemotaxis protein n=1 Tax=Enterovibrio gelatinilyticus TaxID=2899819 RepID=A0ABT5R096_9GAMM|nr:methyl-accepting chemotaxis protein [Enterovibrio sp. ZSDZ42]MDD1793697.1 methyl-accepting chemotaxis protein [Enterovibrio sp. ZSDZ42]
MFSKLKIKLLMIFLLIGVLPILIVGYLALSQSSSALQGQAFAQLVSMREVKKDQILSYFERAIKDTQVLAESEDTKRIQKLLQFYASDEEVEQNEAFPTDTYEYQDIWESNGKTLTNFINLYGYSDVFIIQADTGHVVFTAKRNSDLGANLNSGPLKSSPLAKLYKDVVANNTLTIQDYQRYEPQDNTPIALIGAPITDLSGNVLAVAALQLSMDEINQIMLQRTGMGKSGETYLVGPDFLMRSDSYLDSTSRSIIASFSNPINGTVKTLATERAFNNETGFDVVLDYRDIRVLTAYAPIKFGENDWALIAEIDEDEAFGQIIALKWMIGIALLVGAMIVSVIALLVTRSVTMPILTLTQNLEAVALSGDFSSRVEVKSKDELGQSASAFNTLMNSMQAAICDIKKVMEGLAEGDFSHRIESDLKGDLLSIKLATNTSLENVEASERMKAELERDTKLQAEENARVRQALDNVSTNTMITDQNYNIIYLNRAYQTLLTEAKDDFTQVIPHFNPDEILGKNIDFFHKNPSHQRGILDNLSNTHSLELSVGSRMMAISVNPIIDETGDRIGTVIEWTDRTDEVAIEREIDTMIDAAAQGDFSKQLSLGEKSGFTLKLAQGLNALTTNTDTALEDMQRMLGAMARGDLTQRIEKNYSGRFGQLKADANTSIDKLTQVIGDIRRASETITNSSNEIASGNRDLSQRTEDQATSLQETASSMENMTDTVKESAENAVVANKLSEDARIKAREGGNVVMRTITAMDQISGASNKISDIIGVIDEIAFQTNLLALNAAVEAARAGEQGRGFAVVAGEVRSLAQRSAEAAKEIKELIRDTNKKVEDGAELVIESGDTLQEIVNMVEEVSNKMSDISTAAQEQSSGIEQVNIAVTRMDNMTQQNAALVEEATTAGESMLSQAQDMSSIVEFFTITGKKEEIKSPTFKSTKKRSIPKKPIRVQKEEDDDEIEWGEF